MPEKASHRQYVLDSGALIAHERRNPRVAALMEVAAEHRIEMVLPSAVLARAWRDGARQAILSKMLRNPGLVEAPLHHADAKRVGELLRDSATSDVVDGHVAVLAGRLRVPVITSDPAGISRLNAAIELILV